MRIIYLLALCFLFGSCAKPAPEPEAADHLVPEPATLRFPIKDELCLSGTNTTVNQNTVTFSWARSKNAESYVLSLKNLLSGLIVDQNTTDTSVQMVLSLNTPYSWSVVSKSTKSSTTGTSEVWKFYNPGPGAISYAPFPSEMTAPLLHAAVSPTAGQVELKWKGMDVDNDVLNYDIYFGIAAVPPLVKAANISTSYFAAVASGSKYYWKVITRDAVGNTSESETYDFTVR